LLKDPADRPIDADVAPARADIPPALARPARAALRHRSAEVVVLVAFFLGAAAVLGISVLFPMSDGAPVRLGTVMIGVALAMAGATLVWGDRWPRGVLLAEAAVAVVLDSVLVAYAHTTAGAMGDAVAYLWLMLYVGIFFPSWATPFGVLVAAGYGAGLLASGLPRMVAAWALISLSTWIAGIVLSRVSRAVRRHVATDALTGVLNRAGLHAAADRAFLRTRRRDEDLAVAALDFDGLKQVNDAHGHAAGDRLLTETADAWRSALRGDDVLARTGGDEFVLIMPRTSRDEAAAVLERLRRAHPAAWSAGIARWRPGESLEACLERADQRLYVAKAERRDAATGAPQAV
jgi:diguanylate cyclase (GGDEF)-like protein